VGIQGLKPQTRLTPWVETAGARRAGYSPVLSACPKQEVENSTSKSGVPSSTGKRTSGSEISNDNSLAGNCTVSKTLRVVRVVAGSYLIKGEFQIYFL
jgi:hypothetical protein